MNIIKRDGRRVEFDESKIFEAIKRANLAVDECDRLDEESIAFVSSSVSGNVVDNTHVEEIQDMVENQIMSQGAFEVAKRYIKYRYTRALIRKSNTTDNQILSLIECNNEEVKQENSNKNPTVNSVQRD